MRIAVIGAGISGLGAAWALRDRHDVTIIEQQARPGGHSNTVDVRHRGRSAAVDTGFIVYNELNYPNLTRLLATLEVATEPSDMSFGVSIGGGRIEYAGTSISSMFAQKRNLLRPRFLKMTAEILRFYREAQQLLGQGGGSEQTLGEFLAMRKYSPAFLYDHLLPMGAAIWSAPLGEMLDFPLISFARFFHNHGLLQLSDRPPWRTVSGGSRSYVARIAALLGDRLELGTDLATVQRTAAGVELVGHDGSRRRFDQVVMACHADEALRLLGDADTAECALLGAFRYQPNRAWLHSDPALMPRRAKVWASWNYLSAGEADRDRQVAVTYWMNRLQNIDPALPLFVTLNPPEPPRTDLVHGRFDYDHPLFDRAALAAQSNIDAIQGERRVWFAGAYLGYGFHEDGLRSGLAVAKALGGDIPWDIGVPAAGLAARSLAAAQ